MDLKPCPFDGYPAESKIHGHAGCTRRECYLYSFVMPIDAWNSRAQLPETAEPYRDMTHAEAVRSLRVNVLRHLSSHEIKDFREWMAIYEPKPEKPLHEAEDAQRKQVNPLHDQPTAGSMEAWANGKIVHFDAKGTPRISYAPDTFKVIRTDGGPMPSGDF